MKLIEDIAARLKTEFNRIQNQISSISVSSSGKYIGEIFQLEEHPSLIPPSPSFPAICISRTSQSDSKTVNLLSENWTLLVSKLRSLTWFFGASDAIDYSGFTPAVQTVIQLDTSGTKNSDMNDPLIQKINFMVRYHDSIDFSDSITSGNWDSLNLVCRFNGSDYRIIGFDAINRTITIDYDSSSDTSTSGIIKIYPHRIRTIDVNSSTTAQIRKLKPETTLASTYQSGILLTHQAQGHKHLSEFGTWEPGSTIGNYAHGGTANGSGSGIVGLYSVNTINDGANGTPQIGETNRSNQYGIYLFMNGGNYVP